MDEGIKRDPKYLSELVRDQVKAMNYTLNLLFELGYTTDIVMERLSPDEKCEQFLASLKIHTIIKYDYI